jgi:hypothetical protein
VAAADTLAAHDGMTRHVMVGFSEPAVRSLPQARDHAAAAGGHLPPAARVAMDARDGVREGAMTYDHMVSNAAVFALVIAIAAALLLLGYFAQELADAASPDWLAVKGVNGKAEAAAISQAAATAAGPLKTMALDARDG